MKEWTLLRMLQNCHWSAFRRHMECVFIISVNITTTSCEGRMLERTLLIRAGLFIDVKLTKFVDLEKVRFH